MTNDKLYIVLDNVRYYKNLGPIFRLADAFNVTKIFICRANREEFNQGQIDIIKKISRGASEYVHWELVQDTLHLIETLQADGVSIVSLDIRTDKLLSDNNLSLKYPMALVFGHEGHGVDPKIIETSDMLLKIPMFGKGTSLNIASSVAIVLYKIRELTNL